MATRANLAVTVLVIVCLCATARADITLHSKHRDVSLRVAPPSGWGGPGYGARPSYDSFGWSHGEDPAACYLQVRFDAFRDEPGDRHSPDDIVVHWNSTPLPKIREQYEREFQQPRVEYLQTVRVAGQPARVHGVYDADGHFYAAEIRRAGTVISFELRSHSRSELQRHKASFLSFLRSVRIP